MAKIYADLIINNLQEFSKIPKNLQDEVISILNSYVLTELITEDELQVFLSK